MHTFLLVASDSGAFSRFAEALTAGGAVELSWARSGRTALDRVADGAFDAVVTDEQLADMTGLELAARLIAVNPMVNCAAVSSLSPEDFHAASEGLGLMDPLPPYPGKEEADKLLQHLTELKNLMGRG